LKSRWAGKKDSPWLEKKGKTHQKTNPTTKKQKTESTEREKEKGEEGRKWAMDPLEKKKGGGTMAHAAME